VLFKAAAYVSDCVITDFATRPVAKSEEFIRALAALPPNTTAREIMRLKYGDEEAETLWLNVEYVLDQCVGRVYEILGVED